MAIENVQQDEVTITVSKDSLYFMQLLQNQKKLRAMELENARLKERLAMVGTSTASNPKRKKVVNPGDNAYNPLKSNGVPKAKASESISSYDDFKRVQDCLLEHGGVRDWCLWTIGVGLGLRVSDLLLLQFRNVLDENKNVRERILVYEKKTGKLNNVLITECVADAIKKYCVSIGWDYNPEWFLFRSRKGGGAKPMSPEHGWYIISQAAKDAGLTMHVGSHTMRKSFANIAACVDNSVIDMNTIVKVQGLLNHKDQMTTMRYLGSLQDMYDRARRSVSDFVMGKSGVNEIVAGGHKTIDDIFDKIDELNNSIRSAK